MCIFQFQVMAVPKRALFQFQVMAVPKRALSTVGVTGGAAKNSAGEVVGLVDVNAELIVGFKATMNVYKYFGSVPYEVERSTPFLDKSLDLGVVGKTIYGLGEVIFGPPAELGYAIKPRVLSYPSGLGKVADELLGPGVPECE